MHVICDKPYNKENDVAPLFLYFINYIFIVNIIDSYVN